MKSSCPPPKSRRGRLARARPRVRRAPDPEAPLAPRSSDDRTQTPQPDAGAPLRVALDLRLIHSGEIGVYLTGLLEGFASLGAPIQWTFIGPRAEVPSALKVSEWIEFDAPLDSLEQWRHYPRLPPVDLFHYPNYNLPLARARRRVVTAYDLLPLLYGSFTERFYQRFFLRRLAWSRASVMTVSAKSREELIEIGRIAARRVQVVDFGPGRVGGRALRPRRPGPLELRDGTRLEPPWLLALGMDRPHENMDFLIAALAMWYQRRPAAPPLLWTGVPAERVAALMASIPAHARTKIHVEPEGREEKNAPEAIHAGACALIFPSLDAGCGFAPLEAMARRVPVLCSRVRPMTDLLGKAPLWFDPYDSATLWRQLDRLLDESGLPEDMAERGLKQAQNFTWRKAAEGVLRFYTRVAAGKI